jgi:hypothetical protein
MTNKRHGPECLFIAAFVLLLVYQVLLYPIVGLPDNGDFPRMMKSVGLSRIDNGHPASFRSFPRYYHWDLSKREKPFPSSQLLFVTAALAVNGVMSKTEWFDITSVGIVHSFLYALAFGLVAYCGYRTQHRLRWLVYLALLLVFGDVAYAAYFNSLYAEPAALIFLCFSLGFALLAIVRPKERSASRIPVIGCLCCVILFTVAKLQNVMLAPFFAVMMYSVARLAQRDDTRQHRRVSGIGVTAAVAVLVAACGYWALYSIFPMGIRNVNVYDSVFFEIIKHSPNPKADLQQLGLDPSYVKYRGTHAWSPGVTPEVYSRVYERVGEKRIILFYLRNPGRFFALQWSAAKHGFDVRPGYLGNFDNSSVDRIAQAEKSRALQPGESRNAESTGFDRLPGPYLSHACDLISEFKKQFLVGSSWPLALFFFVNVAVVAIKFWRFDTTLERRTVSVIHGMLILMACFQFLTVTLGAGELDLVKHLFLFDVLCDVCFIFLIGYLAWALGPKAKCRVDNGRSLTSDPSNDQG